MTALRQRLLDLGGQLLLPLSKACMGKGHRGLPTAGQPGQATLVLVEDPVQLRLDPRADLRALLNGQNVLPAVEQVKRLSGLAHAPL